VKNGNGGSSGDDWHITHRPLNSGIFTTSPEVLEGTPDLTLSWVHWKRKHVSWPVEGNHSTFVKMLICYERTL
jgi:hypothetical protein